jgi:hypothetical protein
MPHGADADRVIEEAEHGGVVGGISDVEYGVPIGIDIDTVIFSQNAGGPSRLYRSRRATPVPINY